MNRNHDEVTWLTKSVFLSAAAAFVAACVATAASATADPGAEQDRTNPIQAQLADTVRKVDANNAAIAATMADARDKVRRLWQTLRRRW